MISNISRKATKNLLKCMSRNVFNIVLQNLLVINTQPELPRVAGNIMHQQSLSINLTQNFTTSLHPS